MKKIFENNYIKNIKIKIGFNEKYEIICNAKFFIPFKSFSANFKNNFHIFAQKIVAEKLHIQRNNLICISQTDIDKFEKQLVYKYDFNPDDENGENYYYNSSNAESVISQIKDRIKTLKAVQRVSYKTVFTYKDILDFSSKFVQKTRQNIRVLTQKSAQKSLNKINVIKDGLLSEILNSGCYIFLKEYEERYGFDPNYICKTIDELYCNLINYFLEMDPIDFMGEDAKKIFAGLNQIYDAINNRLVLYYDKLNLKGINSYNSLKAYLNKIDSEICEIVENHFTVQDPAQIKSNNLDSHKISDGNFDELKILIPMRNLVESSRNEILLLCNYVLPSKNFDNSMRTKLQNTYSDTYENTFSPDGKFGSLISVIKQELQDLKDNVIKQKQYIFYDSFLKQKCNLFYELNKKNELSRTTFIKKLLSLMQYIYFSISKVQLTIKVYDHFEKLLNFISFTCIPFYSTISASTHLNLHNHYLQKNPNRMRLLLNVKLNGIPVNSAFLDTGSPVTIISDDIMDKMGWTEKNLELKENVNDFHLKFTLSGTHAKIYYPKFDKDVETAVYYYPSLKELFGSDMLLGLPAIEPIFEEIINFAEDYPYMVQKSENGLIGSIHLEEVNGKDIETIGVLKNTISQSNIELQKLMIQYFEDIQLSNISLICNCSIADAKMQGKSDVNIKIKYNPTGVNPIPVNINLKPDESRIFFKNMFEKIGDTLTQKRNNYDQNNLPSILSQSSIDKFILKLKQSISSFFVDSFLKDINSTISIEKTLSNLSISVSRGAKCNLNINPTVKISVIPSKFKKYCDKNNLNLNLETIIDRLTPKPKDIVFTTGFRLFQKSWDDRSSTQPKMFSPIKLSQEVQEIIEAYSKNMKARKSYGFARRKLIILSKKLQEKTSIFYATKTNFIKNLNKLKVNSNRPPLKPVAITSIDNLVNILQKLEPLIPMDSTNPISAQNRDFIKAESKLFDLLEQINLNEKEFEKYLYIFGSMQETTYEIAKLKKNLKVNGIIERKIERKRRIFKTSKEQLMLALKPLNKNNDITLKWTNNYLTALQIINIGHFKVMKQVFRAVFYKRGIKRVGQKKIDDPYNLLKYPPDIHKEKSIISKLKKNSSILTLLTTKLKEEPDIPTDFIFLRKDQQTLVNLLIRETWSEIQTDDNGKKAIYLKNIRGSGSLHEDFITSFKIKIINNRFVRIAQGQSLEILRSNSERQDMLKLIFTELKKFNSSIYSKEAEISQNFLFQKTIPTYLKDSIILKLKKEKLESYLKEKFKKMRWNRFTQLNLPIDLNGEVIALQTANPSLTLDDARFLIYKEHYINDEITKYYKRNKIDPFTTFEEYCRKKLKMLLGAQIESIDPLFNNLLSILTDIKINTSAKLKKLKRLIRRNTPQKLTEPKIQDEFCRIPEEFFLEETLNALYISSGVTFFGMDNFLKQARNLCFKLVSLGTSTTASANIAVTKMDRDIKSPLYERFKANPLPQNDLDRLFILSNSPSKQRIRLLSALQDINDNHFTMGKDKITDQQFKNLKKELEKRWDELLKNPNSTLFYLTSTMPIFKGIAFSFANDDLRIFRFLSTSSNPPNIYDWVDKYSKKSLMQKQTFIPNFLKLPTTTNINSSNKSSTSIIFNNAATIEDYLNDTVKFDDIVKYTPYPFKSYMFNPLPLYNNGIYSSDINTGKNSVEEEFQSLNPQIVIKSKKKIIVQTPYIGKLTVNKKKIQNNELISTGHDAGYRIKDFAAVIQKKEEDNQKSGSSPPPKYSLIASYPINYSNTAFNGIKFSDPTNPERILMTRYGKIALMLSTSNLEILYKLVHVQRPEKLIQYIKKLNLETYLDDENVFDDTNVIKSNQANVSLDSAHQVYIQRLSDPYTLPLIKELNKTTRFGLVLRKIDNIQNHDESVDLGKYVMKNLLEIAKQEIKNKQTQSASMKAASLLTTIIFKLVAGYKAKMNDDLKKSEAHDSKWRGKHYPSTDVRHRKYKRADRFLHSMRNRVSVNFNHLSEKSKRSERVIRKFQAKKSHIEKINQIYQKIIVNSHNKVSRRSRDVAYNTSAEILETSNLYSSNRDVFENLKFTSTFSNQSSKGFLFSKIQNRSEEFNYLNNREIKTINAANTSRENYADYLNGRAKPSRSITGYIIPWNDKLKFIHVKSGKLSICFSNNKYVKVPRDLGSAVIIACKSDRKV